jgi:hypothetical protein
LSRKGETNDIFHLGLIHYTTLLPQQTKTFQFLTRYKLSLRRWNTNILTQYFTVYSWVPLLHLGREEIRVKCLSQGHNSDLPRPGLEPLTFRCKVQHRNHLATESTHSQWFKFIQNQTVFWRVAGKFKFATVKSALTVANHKLEGSYSLILAVSTVKVWSRHIFGHFVNNGKTLQHTKSCYFHLRNIGCISNYNTEDACKTLVNSIQHLDISTMFYRSTTISSIHVSILYNPIEL